MRLFLLFIIITTHLYAKSKESCYTVQLISKFNSQKNLDLLHSESYPKSCKLMEIGRSLTVRCGCFEKYIDAKNEQKSHFSSYKKATLATTYKYRFDSSVVESMTKKQNFQEKPKPKPKMNSRKNHIPSKEDEELRLILQVFLYKSDLESAYNVASLGYKKHPNSYYWNQKMAEVSRWTNRSARSMKHLRFMYNYKYDPKIEKELIDYGSEYYQYEAIEPLVVNRAKKNPSEKNIDLMILVFRKIGSPEKVVAVLDEQYQKDKSNTMLLTKALELSLEIGDLELALKYVTLIENNKPYSKKDASLIARYYYVTHRIPLAYESLNAVGDEKEPTYDFLHKDDNSTTHIGELPHVKYYQLKSDLGWYLQDNLKAATASKHLMLTDDKARLVDYERISFVFQQEDPQLALEATRRAYAKYKLSYLFYSYANGALNSKNYKELSELLAAVDKEKSHLTKEALYWVIKSKVYAYYKKPQQEKEALLKAAQIEPNNFQIKLELLWFFMDMHENKQLKIVLLDMAESEDLNPSSYLPMASAYFYLNDINRASYYMQELIHEESPVTDLLEFKFLLAYIYQIQNNQEAYKSLMIKITKDLKAELKENPELKYDNKFLSNYLRASMDVTAPNKYEKRLKKAKKYLTKKNYDEISYSWAIKNSAYEKSLKIYHRIEKKELWMHFSNALVFQEHSDLEDILDRYLSSLAVGDASQAAYKDGQIALAQTITYEGQQNNEKNLNTYIQHLELSKLRSDKLDIKTAYYSREPLVQEFIKVKDKTYLQNDYYLHAQFAYYLNQTIDKAVLLSVPEKTVSASLGLEKQYTRGSVMASLGYHDSMESYISYLLQWKHHFSTDIYTKILIEKNADALESTQLLLGGKKDMLEVDLIWNILDSTSIILLHQLSSYSSQDDVDLGPGQYSRLSISKQIRNGYPDLQVGAFYDVGVYEETAGSRGVIDELQSGIQPVLPNNFYNIGVNLSYGMANSNLYTRVWRPYIEFFPYYNKEKIESFNYGFNTGIGGKVFHQDHLSIGASYVNAVSGIGGSIFELYLNYRFMYYHP